MKTIKKHVIIQYLIYRMALFRRITSTCFIGVLYLFPTCLVGVYTYKTFLKVLLAAFFITVDQPGKNHNNTHPFINF